ncbi:hypothetical protein Enr13x_25780 [Stieleria neptunia]|uniref:Uncharacterized protein n=1 Tax=Stieleria neptunia TaxID=2527979 RepID=A0A518HPF7_9BACT|nr:AsmA-like C-terminal region-containing protein [Stieleria neptunia]QDV42728.1 hypothetical protein Enr13x_25780 [Stieleria neptunia]
MAIEYPEMMIRNETTMPPVLIAALLIAAILIGATTASPLQAQQAAPAQPAPAQPAPAQPAPAQPAATPPVQSPYRYWTTNWSLQDIAVGDLAKKLRTIGLGLPIQVDGLATVEFEVGVPLNALRTGKAYRLEGSLSIRDLVADQMRFDVFRAEVTYADGRLDLETLRAVEQLDGGGNAVPTAGSIVGSASAELLPRGSFSADVKTANLRIGPVATLFSRLGFDAADGVPQGSVTANVSVRGQVDQLNQPEQLTVEGDFAAKDVRRGPSIGFNLAAKTFSWKQRELLLPHLRIESADRPDFFVSADAKLRFDDSTQFESNLSANDMPLDQLFGLVLADAESIVMGKLDAKGKMVGEIGPAGTLNALDVELSIASPALAVGGVQLGLLEHDIRLTRDHLSLAPRTASRPPTDTPPQAELQSDLIIESLETDFDATDRFARFSNLSGNLFGGTVRGSGQFARNTQLDHSLDLQWDHINPEFTLPIGSLPRRPKLSLQTSGDVQWTVPAAKVLQPTDHRGNLTINLNALKIGEETVGQCDVHLQVQPDALDLSVDGTLLGGTVSIRSAAALETTTRWDQIPGRLRFSEFEFKTLSLRRILDLAMSSQPRFGGRVSLAVTPINLTVDSPSADVALRLDGLTADGVLIARTLRIDADLSNRSVQIKSARGTYAGGQLEVDGQWSLGNGTKLLTARLTRADGSRLLLPIHRQAGDWVGGRVSGRASLAGRGEGIFDSVRISGSANVEKGTTFGIPVGDAYSPLEVTVSVSPLVWRASFPMIRSTLAGGRVTGNMAFRSPGAGQGGTHLRSDWRINHVDFESLLDTYVGTSTIGRGDLTGDFRLEGRNIKDARDLEGQFRMQLGGTDATAVPGLSSAGSLLGATSLVGVRFEQGEAIGRIRNGNMLLESVAMTSDRVNVTATGKVGLLNRRLDIDTVISTGNFQGQNFLLQKLGTQTLTDIVPIGSVNRLLSDRTIVIQMVGPTRDPVIRLMTGETLRANVRRFALQEAFGLVIADSVLFD